jgi:membrane-associated PAP2 superfamily phosphatase
MNPTVRPLPKDLALALALLALLLCWEASGLDLVIAGWYGNAQGFALREAWITRDLLHDGGRQLAGAALAVCVAAAWWGGRDGRARRFAWVGVVLACLVTVPALKRLSGTSCPWDLAEFGGSVAYVPHWLLTVLDGGPGHCFPSGHAVAAFAFLPLYFQWRGPKPRQARLILVTVLAAGAVFGWAQLARGAHFPSHTLWSAWICWAIGAAAARWMDGEHPPVATRNTRAQAWAESMNAGA